MLELGPEHSEAIQRAWSHRLKMQPGKVTSKDGQSKKMSKKSDPRQPELAVC